MGVPPEYNESGTPEYSVLPDEYNRFAPTVEPKKKDSLLKRMLFVLAAAGLAIGGLLGQTSQKAEQPTPTETPAFVAALETPAPTAAPEAAVLLPADTPPPTATPAPTPTPIPAPDAEAIYYYTSSVGHAFVKLIDPEHRFVSGTIRLWMDVVNDSAFDYEITEEDLMGDYVDAGPIDLNSFLGKHLEEFEALDDVAINQFPLVATLTYRNDDGTETTITREAYPQEESWVFTRYHSPDEEPDVDVFPGCFVAHTYGSTEPEAPVVAYDTDAIANGGMCVILTVNGETIPAEYCRSFELTEEWEEDFVFYSSYLVMERPEWFPEHGTAEITYIQHLVNFDFTFTRTETLEY